MKVIGAGFSRTGTLSTKSALERLGFAPCYHMAEAVLPRPGFNDEHLDAWYDYYVGGREMDWQWLLKGYQASVDTPNCLHYRELMQAFPEAVVVLTTRDPDEWFDSWQALWSAFEEAREPRKVVRYHKFLPVMDAILDRHFGGKIERDSNIRVFNAHNESVRRDVPAHKLLEFKVTDGWEPLCGFLDVDVPDAPFPRLNDRESTRGILQGALWTHEPMQL
nr:sulfotransferase family protein [Lysobacter sp. CFH 32150]